MSNTSSSSSSSHTESVLDFDIPQIAEVLWTTLDDFWKGRLGREILDAPDLHPAGRVLLPYYEKKMLFIQHRLIEWKKGWTRLILHLGVRWDGPERDLEVSYNRDKPADDLAFDLGYSIYIVINRFVTDKALMVVNAKKDGSFRRGYGKLLERCQSAFTASVAQNLLTWTTAENGGILAGLQVYSQEIVELWLTLLLAEGSRYPNSIVITLMALEVVATGKRDISWLMYNHPMTFNGFHNANGLKPTNLIRTLNEVHNNSFISYVSTQLKRPDRDPYIIGLLNIVTDYIKFVLKPKKEKNVEVVKDTAVNDEDEKGNGNAKKEDGKGKLKEKEI